MNKIDNIIHSLQILDSEDNTNNENNLSDDDDQLYNEFFNVMISSSKEIDPEIQKFIDTKFWDMIQ